MHDPELESGLESVVLGSGHRDVWGRQVPQHIYLKYTHPSPEQFIGVHLVVQNNLSGNFAPGFYLAGHRHSLLNFLDSNLWNKVDAESGEISSDDFILVYSLDCVVSLYFFFLDLKRYKDKF